jgi:molybdopterin/thiamine biosynthesis adenylyltransferase
MTIEDPDSRRLADARCLIVGVGGLGAPAAQALARAGIGALGLADPDVVELSNLPRQPLYVTTDVGRAKVRVAAERLHALAPRLRLETWQRRITGDDVALARGFDVILDGTDTIAAKFAVNDLAVAARVPLVHAGVLGFRAQLLTVIPHVTACYRCLFEEAPPPGEVPSCNEAGVLGPVTALAAALQADEIIRLLSGAAPAYAGRVLVADLGAGSFRTVPLSPNPRCATCHPPQVSASGRSDAA